MESGKKWLLWGLSMFLFLLLVPLTVHAVRAETVTYEYHGERYRDQEVYVEGDYKYVVLGNEAFLYRYTGTAPTIATPTSFGGKPVTVIMWEAFANNSAIQTVTVNAGVREIYERAFKNCSGLQAVLISASVEMIGGGIVRQLRRAEIRDLPEGKQTDGDQGARVPQLPCADDGQGSAERTA